MNQSTTEIRKGTNRKGRPDRQPSKGMSIRSLRGFETAEHTYQTQTVTRFHKVDPQYGRKAIANVRSRIYANMTSSNSLYKTKQSSSMLRVPSEIESNEQTMFDKSRFTDRSPDKAKKLNKGIYSNSVMSQSMKRLTRSPHSKEFNSINTQAMTNNASQIIVS